MRLFAVNGCQGQDLHILYWCQMALKGIWLLDICMGSGHGIAKSAWEGQSEYDSQYIWPRCAPVSPSDWNLW